jgi:hypothetical protein
MSLVEPVDNVLLRCEARHSKDFQLQAGVLPMTRAGCGFRALMTFRIVVGHDRDEVCSFCERASPCIDPQWRTVRRTGCVKPQGSEPFHSLFALDEEPEGLAGEFLPSVEAWAETVETVCVATSTTGAPPFERLRFRPHLLGHNVAGVITIGVHGDLPPSGDGPPVHE